MFFFFICTTTPALYTLSLHDALPIFPSTGSGQSENAFSPERPAIGMALRQAQGERAGQSFALSLDRKSTRLNSSHTVISYAVFCLKKKIVDNVRPSHAPLSPLRCRRV